MSKKGKVGPETKGEQALSKPGGVEVPPEPKIQIDLKAGRKVTTEDSGAVSAGHALEEALARLEADLRSAEDKYLRALAEFDNMRKRLAREKAEWLQYGHEPVVRDILPIVDNLERALGAASEALQEGDEGIAAKALLEGADLTLRQFYDALTRHGVTPIESLGKPFDPKLHEAVQRVVSDDVAADIVVIEFQKGYFIRDRLLRAARVAVSMEPPEFGGGDGS